MDNIGFTLEEATKTSEWIAAYAAGIMAATTIAEKVRKESSLDYSPISGELASLYLANVIKKTEEHAEKDASMSYGRYRWMWYLRRLPDDVFDGGLASTGPYDRCLTEVLCTKGAGFNHAIGEPSNDGTFPINATVIKRIAWKCGYARAVSGFQVAYRVIGKGGTLTFDLELAGQNFPTCRAIRTNTLDHEICEYDRRNERQTIFSKIGIPIQQSASRSDAMVLFQVGKTSGPLAIADPSVFNISNQVAIRYHPSLIDVRSLKKLLDHPSVRGVHWNQDLPHLISLLYLAMIIFGRCHVSRSQLLQSGYIISKKDELENMYKNNLERFCEIETLLGSFPFFTSTISFCHTLLCMEGRPSPLLRGPVAYNVNDALIALDLSNATQRFHDLLEFPRVHGEPANTRGEAFEIAVRQAIQDSICEPPELIKKLNGHHFIKAGARIGEVDAFACYKDTLILVSCKSVVYTSHYDRGEYSSVRNIISMLEDASTKYSSLASYFRSNPDGGSEYDFTRYTNITSVVVTPHVMFVKEPLLSQNAMHGLRSYLGFEEFQNWLELQSTKV